MQHFIENTLKEISVKHIVIFGTYGGLTNAMQKMRRRLQDLNLPIVPEEFGTKGRAWVFINMFHPNKDALHEADLFAKSIITAYTK